MLWCRTNRQDPNAKPFHVRTSVSEATSTVPGTYRYVTPQAPIETDAAG